MSSAPRTPVSRACSCGPGSSSLPTSIAARPRSWSDRSPRFRRCWGSVIDVSSDRAAAPGLFSGIAPQYSWAGAVLSFGQDPRWRRFMVSKLGAVPGSLVLDVAAGTGLVSRHLAARLRVNVVSLDPSEPMLRAGIPANEASGLAGQIRPVIGGAETLPFADATFDALTFSY